MTDSIREHCSEIDRCNQRGGRMLSVVDLIEAGTIEPDWAAHALAAIGEGASFLVGASPGGAGKTTVMGALLNFVPAHVGLRPADGLAAIERGSRAPRPRCCYVCHEIGRGSYYAYLWGRPLRAFFDLPAAGHMLATNLHADTHEQARRQICRDNAVSESALRQVKLMFFLSVRRHGGRVGRRIETIWESDGHKPHRRLYAADAPAPPDGRSALVSPERLAAARAAIDRLTARGARTIEQVRALLTANDGGK